MKVESLTYEAVRVRAVLVPLKRKVVSRVGFFDHWPLILIDLQTKEGIVGTSYLEPYLHASPRYIMPAISDLVEARKGKPMAPMADFQPGRKSLNLIGYEGVAMIANAGIDMAAWDALAKAADVPLAVLLGGTVGSVPAYNSNGLWLTDPGSLHDEAAELAAEGGFDAFKLRLGRDKLEDDLLAISQVRAAVGSNAKLMVDFNQGLTLGDAIRRCHALDDHGLYWFEEPTTYNNLEGYALAGPRAAHAVATGRELLRPARAVPGGHDAGGRLRDARHDADRWRVRLAAFGSHRSGGRHRGVDPSLSGSLGASHAGHRDGALAGVAGLG